MLGIVQKLLGEYWHGLPQTALVGGHYEQHPEWLARIEGVRLVSALELPERGSWRLPLLKALVAGDPMTARHMRRGSFEFTPQCKLMMAGNHKPNLGTIDKAFESRLVLLPFERTFEGAAVDRELSDKLHAELPRILGWAIEGACKYFIDGLGDKPGSAANAAGDYLAEQDRFGAWAEARLTFAPDAFTPTRELLADYNEFAGAHLTPIHTNCRIPVTARGCEAGSTAREGCQESCTRLGWRRHTQMNCHTVTDCHGTFHISPCARVRA